MTVETLSKVRRLFHIQGWSLRKISRELHISRNTVRKALQSGTTKFSYKRQHQSYLRLERFQSDLDRLLMSNIGKPRRERLTLVRIYEELCSWGFEGSYSCIRHYVQIFSKAHNHTSAAAFSPLIFAPGEAYQFDWSHEIVILNGVTTAVKIAHVRLCNSRMFYIRAYLCEAQEMVFDVHDRALLSFMGAVGAASMTICAQRWMPSWLARIGSLTGVFYKCAVTTWSSQQLALRRRAGKRGRLRTRSG